MKLLIGIRLKSLFYNMKKSFGGKKKGMGALVAVIMLFLLFSVEMMLFDGWNMLSAYLETDFAWLYFALAGLLAFALGIFGTVFTTQSQMYQAKDNELLLAMPIKPGNIVGSRVIVLYLMTFVFVSVVMLPAGVVYCLKFGVSVSFLAVFLMMMVLISLLTQAVTCLLGWVLHFLLAGFRHKAIIATIFMTAVMILYFVGINKVETLMILLVENGGKIASAIQSFAWPFYAIGASCLGDWGQFILLALLCIGAFGIVTVILNATFVKAMLAGGKSKRAVKQKRDSRVRSAEGTICKKEAKRFFTSTTYLVNIGMGLFMIVAFVGAGIILKEKLLSVMTQIFAEETQKFMPVFLIGGMGLLAAMTPISAPSVSLEGKHIWILRSMPVSGAQVLKAKFRFHCVATVPLSAVGTIVLGFVYGLTVPEIVAATIGTALLFVLCGVLGLIFNMCFPRLDWPNEATACKQSMAVFFAIFGMMFVSLAYVLLYFAGSELLGGAAEGVWAILLVDVLFAIITYLCYLLMTKWGGKKFETL